MSDIYKDPILKKYQTLFEAAMPGVFKSFYQGDPIQIPKSSMPAMVMSKSQTRISNLTNAEDQHEIGIILTVITDLRDEISDDTQMVPGIAQLYAIIEAREEATYALKSGTILDVLRSNIEVDATYNLRTDLGSITTANYGLTVDKRAQQGFAIEGQIEFTATFSQVR